MTNKFNRSQKRKEKREAIKNFNKEEKQDLNPNGKPYKKIRKLKDGGIAFGKNYKIGRTGMFSMIGISAVVCMFYLGVVGTFDSFLPPVDDTKYDYDLTEYYTVRDNNRTYYVVKDMDGEFMTDSSGNMLKFTSKETADEFKKRINKDVILNSTEINTSYGSSKQSFLDNIGNFFL